MVKCIKQSFLYLFTFNVMLLSYSFSLQAMEQVGQIEQDWEYKRRDEKSLCCFGKKDDRAYPYFLSEKNNNNVKISEQKITTKYSKIFESVCDISFLNEENKQTLWYVLKTVKNSEKLRIEGGDRYFAHKMAERVIGLPLKVRQKIAEKYGTSMTRNVCYGQPSDMKDVFMNALWDNKDHVRHNVACCGMYSCCFLQCYLWFMLNPPSECIPIPLLIPLGCYLGLSSKINDYLRETDEEEDQRHGFRAKDFISLTEMESSIVDVGKEKVD